jgi:hypothetical protein
MHLTLLSGGMGERFYPRHIDAGEFFEDFLISAVAAILTIRVFLHLTGYPIVGGGTLHIAHMLWGGLLMALALVLSLGFLGTGVRALAAVVGGVGFGTFIDELGKFITRDNDYFFKPTFALIYVVFVLMYLAFRAVQRRSLTRREYLANALELTHEAVRHDLDPEEKKRVYTLLRRSDPDDPIVQALAQALRAIQPIDAGSPGFVPRCKRSVRALYGSLVRRSWFPAAVITFFVGLSVFGLLQSMILIDRLALVLAILIGALFVVLGLIRARQAVTPRFLRALFLLVAVGTVTTIAFVLSRLRLPPLSFLEWGEVVSSVAPAVIVLLGVWRMARSRLDAYLTFRWAVLINIFIGQFFAFYEAQLVAVFGLFLNILVFATLRYMIHQENGTLRTRNVVDAQEATLDLPVATESRTTSA